MIIFKRIDWEWQLSCYKMEGRKMWYTDLGSEWNLDYGVDSCVSVSDGI